VCTLIQSKANRYSKHLYSLFLAILGEPSLENSRAEDFLDIRNSNQDYFNIFFDRLVPCVAGKKVWTSKDKMRSTITDGGKISVTDEAFTELCILNYWEKWIEKKEAKWTDSRRGNLHFKGWSDDAYDKYDEICNRIQAQRTTEESKASEFVFVDYAIEKYGLGSRRPRCGVPNKGRELFDELVE
jgi:hypothetical protein